MEEGDVDYWMRELVVATGPTAVRFQNLSNELYSLAQFYTQNIGQPFMGSAPVVARILQMEAAKFSLATRMALGVEEL